MTVIGTKIENKTKDCTKLRHKVGQPRRHPPDTGVYAIRQQPKMPAPIQA
jgi:hypothetical protein